MHGLHTDLTSSAILISLRNGGIFTLQSRKYFYLWLCFTAFFQVCILEFSQQLPLCVKHSWVGNTWDHLAKSTLINSLVLECRRTPTFSFRQPQAEDIFSSCSLSIEGDLVHIPENTHPFLILIILLVGTHYSKIKYVQDNSKMDCLLKLFHQVNWVNRLENR